MNNKILKVKNTTAIGNLIIAFALFPVVFFITAFGLELGYLIAFFVTITSLSLITFITAYNLNKTNHEYEIVADSSSITIKGKNYEWIELESISSRQEWSFLNNRTKIRIRFVFKNNTMTTLDASNYDIWHEDLVKELNELKGEKTNYIQN